MPSETGLRERKKAQTREALATAAFDLFAERGWEATTVEEIAAAADVSPRTFFRYFPTKEDVLFPDRDQHVAALRLAMEPAWPDEPLHAALSRALVSVASELNRHPGRQAVRIRLVQEVPALTARSLEIQASWEEEVARAVAARLGTDPETDIRPRMVAGAAFGALRAAMHAWAAAGGSSDPAHAVEEALRLVEGGMRDILHSSHP